MIEPTAFFRQIDNEFEIKTNLNPPIESCHFHSNHFRQPTKENLHFLHDSFLEKQKNFWISLNLSIFHSLSIQFDWI